MTRTIAILALAASCVSCAAGTQLRVPAPRAGEGPLGWPPVPVDAYVAADGRRHELPGGYVIERGDSMLFLPRERASRPSLLALEAPAGPESMHRDSVRAVVVRLEDARPDPVGTMLGAVVLLGILTAVGLYAGIYPFLVGS